MSNTFVPCPALDIYAPQFNSGLGTLQSISFTFSASQTVEFGINDDYDPLIGRPFQVTVIGGLDTSSLPIKVQGQEIYHGVSTGVGMAGLGGYYFSQTLSASGTDFAPVDLAAFEGSSVSEVIFQPFASAVVTESANGWPFAAYDDISESATLDITYNYASVRSHERAPPYWRQWRLRSGCLECLDGSQAQRNRKTRLVA